MTQQNAATRLNNSVPQTGMRGGLGRTLLTAFLLLSIVPLSLISLIASRQARYSLQNELREKLSSIAALTEAQIQSWMAAQQLVLTSFVVGLESDYSSSAAPFSPYSSALAQDLDEPRANDSTRSSSQTLFISRLEQKTTRLRLENPAFKTIQLLDIQGQILFAQPLMRDHTHRDGWEQNLTLSQPIGGTGLMLVAVLDPQHLLQAIDATIPFGQEGNIYLLSVSGQILDLGRTPVDDESLMIESDAQGNHSAWMNHPAIQAALAGERGVASYKNSKRIQVVGAYRWLESLDMALIVEQPQATALAASDDLVVVLIGAALGAALLTALIAAAVARRITLPIIELTATAVQIASGDLDQKVPTTRRDEIGILARAFNVMTTKLRTLYEGLEEKVRERTQQLQKANAEIRYRATQLAISAEVGRIATSILDRDVLLAQVVDLIRDCFQAYFVAIYFLDESEQWAVLKEGSGGIGARLKTEAYRVEIDQECLVSQVARGLTPLVHSETALERHTDRHVFPHTRAELAVPLKIGQRKIGVLDVHSTHADAFEENEVMVLETLAGQIAVAIENARAYEIERQAAEQLREVDEFRRRFLSNMSRELRMPLNNIIGFSRVMLKGIDGPITELQREDLSAIYDSGQQLLALINDILDIAQIEAGQMELTLRPLNLAEIAHSVIPTANALLEGRSIVFRHEIVTDLPLVRADPQRLRQVLVKLLSNAAKFTHEGEISLKVWPQAYQVFVSIGDTGIGIPDQYRERVFEMFNQVPSSQSTSKNSGAGLGLTFSKEIIEMHGGTITMSSEEGHGSTFTIALPAIDPLSNE